MDGRHHTTRSASGTTGNMFDVSQLSWLGCAKTKTETKTKIKITIKAETEKETEMETETETETETKPDASQDAIMLQWKM